MEKELATFPCSACRKGNCQRARLSWLLAGVTGCGGGFAGWKVRLPEGEGALLGGDWAWQGVRGLRAMEQGCREAYCLYARGQFNLMKDDQGHMEYLLVSGSHHYFMNSWVSASVFLENNWHVYICAGILQFYSWEVSAPSRHIGAWVWCYVQ